MDEFMEDDFLDMAAREEDGCVLEELEVLTEDTDIIIPETAEERKALLHDICRHPEKYYKPDDLGGRFYGTRLRESKERRISEMRICANLLRLTKGFELLREVTVSPLYRFASACIALDFTVYRRGGAMLLQRLFSAADEYAFSLREGKLRVTLLLNDIWADWREATDEELTWEDPFRQSP